MDTAASICRELGIDPPLASYYVKTGLLVPFTVEGAHGWRSKLRLILAGKKAGLTVQEMRHHIGEGNEMGNQKIMARDHGLADDASAEEIVQKISSYPGTIKELQREIAFQKVTRQHEALFEPRREAKPKSAAEELTTRVRQLQDEERIYRGKSLDETEAVRRLYAEDEDLWRRVTAERRAASRVRPGDSEPVKRVLTASEKERDSKAAKLRDIFPGLTEAESVRKVFEADPSLFQKIQAERHAASGGCDGN